MNIPANISSEKQALLSSLVEQLSATPGVKAVVLGGSYARGTQHAGSDLDLGIYYSEAAPFAIEDIRRIAALAAGQAATVTGFYEWGPWVNGGAWLHTPASKVDFLYRSLEKIDKTIQKAIAGRTYFDYYQQPPYGFYSVIYLAETRICLPLYDPQGRVERLKQRLATYPPALKRKIVSEQLWIAEFTLYHAGGFADKGDVYDTAGCLTRVASCLTQALFALNETYFITDKTAMAEIAAFGLAPVGYVEQLTAILAHPGQTLAELTATVSSLRSAWKAVSDLAGSLYKPMFNL
ncbi:MAG: nucleotidyltransferase domain-containing protein [Anaerolineaceae bacterium]|jgi:hypothetical protein